MDNDTFYIFSLIFRNVACTYYDIFNDSSLVLFYFILWLMFHLMRAGNPWNKLISDSDFPPPPLIFIITPSYHLTQIFYFIFFMYIFSIRSRGLCICIPVLYLFLSMSVIRYILHKGTYINNARFSIRKRSRPNKGFSWPFSIFPRFYSLCVSFWSFALQTTDPTCDFPQ